MKYAKVMILASLFLFVEIALADADKTTGLKIGYVDMNKALMSTKAGQKADQQLQSDFKKKQKELGAKKEDIETMLQNLKKQAMVVSDEVRAQKEKALYEEQLKFQKLVAESNVAIQKREMELTEPILNQLREIIDDVAEKEKYDMILQKADITILWAKAQLDLTDKVVKIFDSKKKGGSKKKASKK